MKTITLKKSELAKLKGLGISVDGIAKQYGITKKEATESMIGFGLTKGRLAPKEYNISLVDDVTVTETSEVEVEA